MIMNENCCMYTYICLNITLPKPQPLWWESKWIITTFSSKVTCLCAIKWWVCWYDVRRALYSYLHLYVLLPKNTHIYITRSNINKAGSRPMQTFHKYVCIYYLCRRKYDVILVKWFLCMLPCMRRGPSRDGSWGGAPWRRSGGTLCTRSASSSSCPLIFESSGSF